MVQATVIDARVNERRAMFTDKEPVIEATRWFHVTSQSRIEQGYIGAVKVVTPNKLPFCVGFRSHMPLQ
jgi:hypothetical protein